MIHTVFDCLSTFHVGHLGRHGRSVGRRDAAARRQARLLAANADAKCVLDGEIEYLPRWRVWLDATTTVRLAYGQSWLFIIAQ